MTDTTLTCAAVAMSVGIPVLLWGGPGVGKTSSMAALAAASGLHFESVVASIREPSDFAGLPIVTGDAVRFAPPAWASRLAAAHGGLLLLDELSTAPPAVQAALLRVVLERTVGDLTLPATVRIVAAANPADQAADGWDLAAPLANRFCHLDWNVDSGAWVDGFAHGFDSPQVRVSMGTRFNVLRAQSRATVASFIRSKPTFLFRVPDNDSLAGRAWPSPRSWDMAADAVAACDDQTAGGLVEGLLVAGCVGASAAAEFLEWRNGLSLPDPEVVLRNPTSFELPTRSDRAYAAISSVVAAVVSDCTPDRWAAGWSALTAAMRADQPDLAVVGARTLLRHRPQGALPPPEVLQQIAPVLREAGLFAALATNGTSARPT